MRPYHKKKRTCYDCLFLRSLKPCSIHIGQGFLQMIEIDNIEYFYLLSDFLMSALIFSFSLRRILSMKYV